VSGPGTASFTAPDAKATSVTFGESGSYVLKLQANSGFAVADGTLEITVNLKAAGGSGLTVRPSNSTECIAPPTPPIPPSILLADPFPDLPSLSSPVAMYQAPGDDTYWYVVQQTGQVVRFENSAAASSVSTFIDIEDNRLVNDGEKGLLDIAFHPGFADNGFVYLCYTHEDNATHELFSRISRFSLDATGEALDPDSEIIILTVPEPYESHNVEQIMFGPDGYLYISTGDGGSSGDPHGNGQNTDTLLGAILRIDVGDGSSGTYAVPADNPFVDGGGSPEIFAYGFRNPWRSSFDSVTGNLWTADVGFDNYEEIDIVVKGGNYGWNTMEGMHCFKPSDCDPTGLELPVEEYDHTQGFSVTGGFVYRGTAIGFLQGQYLYGDYVTGRIWGLEKSGPGQYASSELLDTSLNIVAFAEDHAGELYVIHYGGSIHKIINNDVSQASQLPSQLSGWGCFQDGDVTAFSSHVIPYNINALLWSDHADKGRFMAIPDGKTIDVDDEGRFELPVGSVVGKHFRLGGKLIETRLLLHHEQPFGWKGYTYEWNGLETDATLLEDAKDKEVDGQNWHYPGRAECDACHTAIAGSTLGPEIGQLNRFFVYPGTGVEANQLITLQNINVLTETLSEEEKSTLYYAIDDTAYSAERRSRSYLHANCAHCHQPGGTGGGNMDLRMATSLKDTGICNIAPQGATLGLANPLIVAPGDPDHSILVKRMEDLGGYRMPPLATSVTDTQAIAVIREWISGLSECP
jgi:uncharacterized repeat protein (TIGR03806 family)